jgi:hypothetical protein
MKYASDPHIVMCFFKFTRRRMVVRRQARTCRLYSRTHDLYQSIFNSMLTLAARERRERELVVCAVGCSSHCVL